MAVPSVVYWSLLALYLPIVSMGVLFNLTTLTVIMCTSKLRLDPRNSFIVALAISGTCTFLMALLSHILLTVTNKTLVHLRNEQTGRVSTTERFGELSRARSEWLGPHESLQLVHFLVI